MAGFGTYADRLKEAFEARSELNFGRPVVYGFSHDSAPADKYILLYPLTNTQTGLTIGDYTDDPASEDVFEELIQPAELGFSLEFVRSNAFEQISLCLTNLARDVDVFNSFYDREMSFSRASGIRDLTGQTGGNVYERVQADIFFGVYLRTPEKLIPSIRGADFTGTVKDSIEAVEINVKI